jgi:hypothetical protein
VRREDPIELWIAIGGLGAIALGIALIPLRTSTSASNLAFAFLAFTIVVAEFGGRGAALVTAVLSAMSLDFFLTEPYLTLTMSNRDDWIAFVGLAGCGLIAAAFGTQRARWAATARGAGQELTVLRQVVEHLAAGAPLDTALDDVRRGLGLSAVVLRDAEERVLAASSPGVTPDRIPQVQLTPDALPTSPEARDRLGPDVLQLSEGGGRLRLRTERGVVSLDLWNGPARGLGVDECRTLGTAASILGLALAGRRGGE